jgi:hypothetical protein
MAHAAGSDFDQNFALLWIYQIDFIKFEVTGAVSDNCLRKYAHHPVPRMMFEVQKPPEWVILSLQLLP